MSLFSFVFTISFANSSCLSLLQLDDSFWKPARGTETEAGAETEKNNEEASAVAETVDDDSSEESSQEAPVAGDDDEDEESSPEAPADDVVEEESSPEAPITEQERAASSPGAAQPTSSEESSGAKSRSSSPLAPARNGSRAAVPKVPLSRVLGSSSSIAKPQDSTQSVIAARKRKLRSDGPAETPDPLPVSHQRKSTSPPEKADSYHSGMSMPSSDSQASLDLETNAGYDFCFCLYSYDF